MKPTPHIIAVFPTENVANSINIGLQLLRYESHILFFYLFIWIMFTMKNKDQILLLK